MNPVTRLLLAGAIIAAAVRGTAELIDVTTSVEPAINAFLWFGTGVISADIVEAWKRNRGRPRL